VWLARLARPREGDEDKVFALKVLRKVDGMPYKPSGHLLTQQSSG
jgi:protein kinase A